MDNMSIEERFAGYVAHRFRDAKQIVIDGLERIHGGASRMTYRMGLRYRIHGESVARRIILRIASAQSLIETEVAREFAACRAFSGTEVPVPEPIFVEGDERWLGRPFLAMEEIAGCETDPETLLSPPYAAVREKIGLGFCRIMGRIARIDPDEIGLGDIMEVPEPQLCWRRELDYWEGVIDQDELEPQPVARAAIRWLRRNRPPPAEKISVVHGDYRIGNVLYDTTGAIRGVLDWEMCHLGDPLEDLAYALNPLWSLPEPHKLGLMLPREEAVAVWQEASGLAAEPRVLHWWEIFAMVKAMAIWISASREYADGRNLEPIMAYSGWSAGDIQAYLILNAMGRV